MHVSHMAKRLAQKVTIYTNGDGERASTLQSLVANENGFEVDSRPIVKLEKNQTGPKITIYFEDGNHTKEAFLVSIASSGCLLLLI